MDNTGFLPSELRMPYDEWCKVEAAKLPTLGAAERQWLGAWRLVDLMLSPMDDKERQIARTWHHHGYFDAMNDRTQARKG